MKAFLDKEEGSKKPIACLLKKAPGKVFALPRSLTFHHDAIDNSFASLPVGSNQASQATVRSVRSSVQGSSQAALKNSGSSRSTLSKSNQSSRQFLPSNQSSSTTLNFPNFSGLLSTLGGSSVSNVNSTSCFSSSSGAGKSRQRRIFNSGQCDVSGGWAFRYAEFQGALPVPNLMKASSKQREHGTKSKTARQSTGVKEALAEFEEEKDKDENKWRAKIAPPPRTIRRRPAISGLGQSKIHVKSAIRLFGRRNFDKLVKLRKLTNPDEEEEETKMTREEMLAELAKETELDSKECEELGILFDKYDKDGSGVLDRSEVEAIFADKGMEPKTREEKMEINELLCEVDRDGSGEFSLFEFGLVMVKVDRKMRQLQLADLQQKFLEADKDCSGELEILEVMEILEKLQLAPKNQEEHEMIKQLVIETDADQSGEVNFEEFQNLVRKIRVEITMLRRHQEKRIAADHCLGPKLFEEFRPELTTLFNAFARYDVDGSGYLDHEETMAALNDIGLLPKTRAERAEIEDLCQKLDTDCDKQFCFREFLVLMSRAKIMIREKRQADLQALFEAYDSDGSGELGSTEIVKIIEDFGIQPKTREEQDQIKEVLQEVDEDGSGSLEFNEFQTLIQRILVRLQRMQRDNELRVAKELGFSTQQLKEYHKAFDTLDPEGGGHLNISSIRQVLRMLHMNVSSDELRVVFQELDEDKSGFLEFSEFLKFIKMTEKKAGKWTTKQARRSQSMPNPEEGHSNTEG